jgi:hypothetical protein
MKRGLWIGFLVAIVALFSLSDATNSSRRLRGELLRSISGESPDTNVAIILERIGCYDDPLWYRLMIRRDGLIKFQGRGGTKVEGTLFATISRVSVGCLMNELEANSFFSISSPYKSLDAAGARDAGAVMLQATHNHLTHTVITDCADSRVPCELANQIDLITGSSQWVGHQAFPDVRHL